MNSRQRRNHKRKMIFGFRKLAMAAKKAAFSMSYMAYSVEMFQIAVKACNERAPTTP